MVVKEEFKLKNASGHTVTLQNLTKGISYPDFGMTHLPRDFRGYRVKYTDRIADSPPARSCNKGECFMQAPALVLYRHQGVSDVPSVAELRAIRNQIISSGWLPGFHQQYPGAAARATAAHTAR